MATGSDFSTITATATVGEGSGETTYTPSSDLLGTSTLFWRVTALDASSPASSAPSASRRVTPRSPSTAEAIAVQQGVVLWPVIQPPGTNGHTSMSSGWEVEDRFSYDGQAFRNPPIEALRLFDLMDRGLEPDAAVNWLSANGYPSTGQYYASVDVIGIPHVYLARIGGAWELVLRAGG